MTSAAQLEQIVVVLTAWAERTPSILGLALIGSHARGVARADSDIDVMVLTQEPDLFLHSVAWIEDIDWGAAHSSIAGWRDVQYGRVWSRHFRLADGSALELSFAEPNWAAVDPLDAGTRDAIAGGFRVLFDREHLLRQLATHAA